MTGSFSSKYIKKKSEAAIFINLYMLQKYLTLIIFTLSENLHKDASIFQAFEDHYEKW